MLTFTSDQLRQRLMSAGIPAWGWQLADSEFVSISDDYPAKVWHEWIESLRLNAPQLLEVRQLGGGATRLVPKWRLNGGDCENHALLAMAHAMTGNWIRSVESGVLAGMAHGVLFYTAEPRSENLHRAGRHCVRWFINHADEFKIFEDGDGFAGELTPTERISADFGLAA